MTQSEISIDACSRAYSVTPKQIRSASRARKYARPRFAVMHILSKCAGFSSSMIGRALDRDHTTVLNGLHRHGELMRRSAEYRAAYSVAEDLYIDGTAKEAAKLLGNEIKRERKRAAAIGALARLARLEAELLEIQEGIKVNECFD